MNCELEIFPQENWKSCLEKQLQGLKSVPQQENSLYTSLYEYAKGRSIFLPNTDFEKINYYAETGSKKYISQRILRLEKLNLITLEYKPNPDNKNLRRVRFIHFHVHPKKKVIWSK